MSSDTNDILDEGIRLLQLGDTASAARYFAHVTERDPANGRAYGFLGIALTRMGDSGAGLSALQESARLQSQDAGAQYNVGVALAQAQRHAEARAAMERTLALDPNHAQARAALQHLDTLAPPTAVEPTYTAMSTDRTQAFPPSSAPQPSPYMPPSAAPIPTSTVQGGYGSLPPLPAGAPVPVAAQGMHYTPTPPQQRVAIPPPTGVRIGRGLGWGALYGQWWTLWNVFWLFVWNGSELTHHFSTLFLVVGVIVVAVVFALVGSIAGLLMALMNSRVQQGAIIGVVFGLILCGLEALLTGNAGAFVNIVFWFFTGRYVGANIAARIQRPLYS